ncbi:hypothetical protein [Nocardia tengchongensis]|uniref:hypothetical protein n=1 Tax=Nocardia tengchongensis TaxID=2055889 RepID=UPI00368DFE4B
MWRLARAFRAGLPARTVEARALDDALATLYGRDDAVATARARAMPVTVRWPEGARRP